MEDLPLSRLKIWKGETDPDVIREKLNTGKYILGTVTVDDDGEWKSMQPCIRSAI